MMDIQGHNDFTVQQVGTKAKRRTKTKMMRTQSTQTGTTNLFETEPDRDHASSSEMIPQDLQGNLLNLLFLISQS